MTTLTAGQPGDSPIADRYPALRAENITLAPGSTAFLSMVCLIAAVVGLGVTLATGLLGIGSIGVRHVLASFMVGVMSVTAVSAGALFFVMIFHLVNAGWTGTVRRTFENLAGLMPLCIGLIAIVAVLELFVTKGALYDWLRSEGDYILSKKSWWLNPGFFGIRVALYAVVFTGLSRLMKFYSLQYDQTGDAAYMAAARRASAPGMVVFALCLTALSVDFFKAVDFKFFSTMWGVYYFSGAAFASSALVVLILALLRRRGKLEGVVTVEHFHDLGKLMFAFTCFWAYIAFFQYFLIWYANIPEETAFYVARKAGGWEHLFTILKFGHFGALFVIMIFRPVKRHPTLLIPIAVWMLLMHVIDMYWVIRPAVYAAAEPNAAPPPGSGYTSVLIADAPAILGVWGLYLFFVVRAVASGPLTALRDPRMHEAMNHRNYV